MERVRIGVVGFGIVGQSFYNLLTCNAGEFAQRLGVTVEVPYVGVRNPAKPHPVGPGTRLITGWEEMLSDPSLPIIVELVGGIDVPLALIREALSRGKHVITANKALISAHGQELFELASANGVELKFEGAVRRHPHHQGVAGKPAGKPGQEPCRNCQRDDQLHPHPHDRGQAFL
jgi:homoserine dehydrogenase